ncbi:MAG: hypothetical protein P8L42_00040, partial [Flavicella sp.]|nr:hypothetical protein [Flavicella sp.]
MNFKLKKRKSLYLDRFFKIIMKTFVFLFCTVLFAVSPTDGFSQDADIAKERIKFLIDDIDN